MREGRKREGGRREGGRDGGRKGGRVGMKREGGGREGGMQCEGERRGRRESGQESRSLGWWEGCGREGVRKGGRDRGRRERGGGDKGRHKGRVVVFGTEVGGREGVGIKEDIKGE